MNALTSTERSSVCELQGQKQQRTKKRSISALPVRRGSLIKNGGVSQGSNSPLSPFPNGEIIAWDTGEALCAPIFPLNFQLIFCKV